MERQPQNPEFRMHPENLHPWFYGLLCIVVVLIQILKIKTVRNQWRP